MIEFTVKNHLKPFDGIFQRDEFAWGSGEDLSDLEGLTEETLDLSGASHRQLVVFWQLVHTQDGNDVL